ncbi:MAG: hypothetical protein LW630_04880 [Saprospiraceae bacterium]|jgi:hypothetical protein|nr:hypothetical protein [Saprospiraceae bacterium]
MKVLVDISDNEATFGVKVLKSLSFVKTVEQVDTATLAIWENLHDAAEEVRLHKNGNIKLKTIQDVIDEL